MCLAKDLRDCPWFGWPHEVILALSNLNKSTLKVAKAVLPVALLSLILLADRSYSAEYCHMVSDGPPTSTTGPVRLYVSKDYASSHSDLEQIVGSMGSGITCSHTRPATKIEQLSCSNGLKAAGITKTRPCSASEKYYSRSGNFQNYLLCSSLGYVPYMDWVVIDRNGQSFNDYNEDWESVSPPEGCVLMPSGNYESRGYRFLRLTAGDFKLYFVRDELNVYGSKRQPAL